MMIVTLAPFAVVGNISTLTALDYLGFGLSGEIAALIAENLDTVELHAPVMRLAVPNVPIPYSRPLEQFVIPQVASIVQAVQAAMLKKTASTAHA
jgi:pyruvate dehydrogenase E1 component beta subunit